MELPLDLPPTQLQSLSPATLPDPAVAEGQGTYEVAPPQVGSYRLQRESQTYHCLPLQQVTAMSVHGAC